MVTGMVEGFGAEARAAYERDGYFAPIPVLSESEAGAVRRRLEDMEARHPAAARRHYSKTHLLAPWLDELARHSGIVDVAESLFGPDLLCCNCAFRSKMPGPAHAAWHQDAMYMKIEPAVSVWLAISELTPMNGTLRAIPGSHKWPLLGHRDSDDPDSVLTRGQYITDAFDETAAVDVVLRPGEAGIFHHMLVHGSGPNRSDDRRLLFLPTYCPTWARNDGPRATAILVRGTDTHGNFGPETPPDGEMTAAALAEHRRAIEMGARTMYKGAARPPRALT
jgi:non-heme Fe2+,alpha-ketoglutarate-dependent halogenase